MKVEKINALDVFDDDNNGLIFGLEEVNNNFPSYIEWFKTEAEREKVIKINKFKVVN